MIVVIDARAALELVLRRDAHQAIGEKVGQADRVIAPGLFCAEVSNAIWKYHIFGQLPLDRAEELLDIAQSIPDELEDDRVLYREAFALACLTQQSVYDMLYLVLARRNNGMLLTMDQQLKRTAQNHSIRFV